MKLHQLSRYAPKMLLDIKTRIRKFTLVLSHELILDSKNALLIYDMDIYGLVVHIQLVELKKRKQADIEERKGNKFRLSV